MIVRRTVLLAVLLFTALGLQTALLGSLTLNGTKPELVLLVVLSLAIVEGPAFGAVAGFGLGLGTDVILALPQGVGALAFTVAGYGLGRIRMQMRSPSAWMPILMVSVATFITVLFYGGFSLLVGQVSLPAARILRHAALAAGYNALLTPLVFPVVRAAATATRPRSSEVIM
jgi:rod shape-determining protein MreD